MSVIKAKLREQAAKFISLRETLEQMAKTGGGCTMQEAATFLYRAISKRKTLCWRTIFCGEIIEADNGYAAPLLDLIVKKGSLKFSLDDFYSLSDCDQYGFLRSELIDFLSTEGVHLLEKPNAAPEWAMACKGIRRFTLVQAASVLIGLDPMDDRWPGDDGQRELDKAYTALQQAVDDGDFLPVGKDDNDRSLFHVQDLRAWAASVGREWLIPFNASENPVIPTGAADEATRQRLSQLEAENARLAERVADLEVELSNANDETKWSQRRILEEFDRRAELERQLQEATAAQQQAPQQATAAPQVEEDKLHPKERTTFLNITGAMLDLLVTNGRWDSETKLIETLYDAYKHKPGISERTLQTKFAEAKKSINSG